MTPEIKKDKTPDDVEKEVSFKCQVCGELKPLEDMRTVNRFFPLLVVCRDCEKSIL